MRLRSKFWKWVLLTIVALGVILSLGFCALIYEIGNHPLGRGKHWGTIQYRETLNFEVDGEPYAVSSVYKQDFVSSTTSNGSRMVGKFTGEALALDFGVHGRFYKLLGWGLSPELIAVACGIEGHGLTDSKDRTMEMFMNDVLSFEGECERPSITRPMMARFGDESDPTTIEYIYPMELMEATDGAVDLINIVYERATDPVTSGVLVQYLPWLATPEKIDLKDVPDLHFTDRSSATHFKISWFIRGEK